MLVVEHPAPDVTCRRETGVVDVLDVAPVDGIATGVGLRRPSRASSYLPSARSSCRMRPSAVTHIPTTDAFGDAGRLAVAGVCDGTAPVPHAAVKHTVTRRVSSADTPAVRVVAAAYMVVLPLPAGVRTVRARRGRTSRVPPPTGARKAVPPPGVRFPLRTGPGRRRPHPRDGPRGRLTPRRGRWSAVLRHGAVAAARAPRACAGCCAHARPRCEGSRRVPPRSPVRSHPVPPSSPPAVPAR